MSLYDDVPQEASGTPAPTTHTTTGWTSAAAAFVPHSILLNKNANAQNSSTLSTSASQNNTSAQVAAIRAKASSLRMQLQAKTTPPTPTAMASSSSSSPSPSPHPHKKQKLTHGSTDVMEDASDTSQSTLMSEQIYKNEYDPLLPNDYEVYCSERIQKKLQLAQEEEEERIRQREEREKQREEREREREERERERDERRRLRERTRTSSPEHPKRTRSPDASDIRRQPSPPSSRHPAAPSSSFVPNLNVSGEEAFRRRALLSQGAPPPLPPPPPPAPSFHEDSSGASDDVAKRMMKKMGWKEGQGLGRSDQGIKNPLEVRSMGRKSGTIVEGSAQPSCVLLLENMVGAGEVDGDLKAETIEECSKFGKVLDCKIIEDPRSVRIFLHFAASSSAQKGKEALHGRFFGGRTVKATYYPENAFKRGEF